jgi:hypothetical protein
MWRVQGTNVLSIFFYPFSVFTAIWCLKVCTLQQHKQNLEEWIRSKFMTNFRMFSCCQGMVSELINVSWKISYTWLNMFFSGNLHVFLRRSPFLWSNRGRGMMLTTHPHLVPWLRMSRSNTSSPLQAPPWSVAGLIWFVNTYLIMSCSFLTKVFDMEHT